MKIKEKHTYTFPSYAISALINGDYSGLEEDDEKNLKGFLKRESYIDEWDVDSDQDPSFTSHPAFGLACDCVEVTGIVWDKEEENKYYKATYRHRGDEMISVLKGDCASSVSEEIGSWGEPDDFEVIDVIKTSRKVYLKLDKYHYLSSKFPL